MFDTHQQLTSAVQDDSSALTNWHSFLRLNENKIKLLCYLTQYLVKNHGQYNTQLICSFDTMSISSDPDARLSFISPCNHEEVDTRVFLHTKGMALKGHKSILIRTVDTDVLLLSLASFFHLAGEIDQFWINFGTEKNRQLTVCRPECTIYRPYRFLMLIFLKLHTIVSHNKHVNSKH